MTMMMLNLLKKLPHIQEKILNVLAKIILLEIKLIKKDYFPQILPQKKANTKI